MIGDIITPSQRLARLSPNRWQSRLALCFIAAACILDGTTHSLRAMADDNINFEDLLRVLRSCRVTESRLENGEWRWNAEGRDKDGRALVFVVVLTDENEEIEIVTAWAV